MGVGRQGKNGEEFVVGRQVKKGEEVDGPWLGRPCMATEVGGGSGEASRKVVARLKLGDNQDGDPSLG